MFFIILHVVFRFSNVWLDYLDIILFSVKKYGCIWIVIHQSQVYTWGPEVWGKRGRNNRPVLVIPQVVCHELCIYTVGVLNTWQLSVIITPANIIKTCPVQSFFLFKRIVTFPTFYGTTHGSSYKPHAPMSTKYWIYYRMC